MRKAFLLGAGATCGTLKPLSVPVAKNFGKELHGVLSQTDAQWTDHYSGLLRVVEHLGFARTDWALEPVWSCIDYYSKLVRAIPNAEDWAGASAQLRKALLVIYGQRCDEAADKLPLNASYTLGKLVGEDLADGDWLVSFNYDTVAERLARRFNRSLRHVRQLGHDPSLDQAGDTVIVLAKPHGSLSWAMNLSTNAVTFESHDSLRPGEVDCGREPLVLGAVPIKSELIWQVQAYPSCNGRNWMDVFDTITAQWQTVITAIRDTDAVILVGYSLPPEDQYGRFLVAEALRQRRRLGRKKLRIEFFELETAAPQRAQEILSAFAGHVETLVYREEVTPPTSGAA